MICYKIEMFNKNVKIREILEYITKLLQENNKYTIQRRVNKKKIIPQKEIEKFKNTKSTILNKFSYKSFNQNRDEFLKEFEESLGFLDITSNNINYVYIETNSTTLFVLISKLNRHGQGNTSVSNITPKASQLNIFYKITKISEE